MALAVVVNLAAANPAVFLSRLVAVAPAVEMIAAAVIARKLSWRRQPATLAFLVSECWIQALWAAGWMTRDAAILVQVVTGALLVKELCRVSRVAFAPALQAAAAAGAVGTCVCLAAAHPWTLDYKLSLLRCDVRIARALACVAIAVYRWRRPALETPSESARNRVHRIGVTAWLVAEAVQGAFVQGGPGMVLLHYSPARWVWVGIVTGIGVLSSVVWMAVAMTAQAPGRKRAAKRRDGRTVTGMIEFERVA